MLCNLLTRYVSSVECSFGLQTTILDADYHFYVLVGLLVAVAVLLVPMVAKLYMTLPKLEKQICEQADTIKTVTIEIENQNKKSDVLSEKVEYLKKNEGHILKSVINQLKSPEKRKIIEIEMGTIRKFLDSEQEILTGETFKFNGLSWYLTLKKKINLAGKRDLGVYLCYDRNGGANSFEDWSVNVKFDLKVRNSEISNDFIWKMENMDHTFEKKKKGESDCSGWAKFVSIEHADFPKDDEKPLYFDLTFQKLQFTAFGVSVDLV